MLYIYAYQPSSEKYRVPICDIKTLQKEDNQIFVQFFYKNGTKNTTPFWSNIPKGEIPKFDYCLDDSFVYTYNPELSPARNDQLIIWGKKQQKVVTGQYKNGKKEGVWNTFYPNGKLHQQLSFQNGNEISRESWYITGQQNLKIYSKDNVHYNIFWQEGTKHGDDESRRETIDYESKDKKNINIISHFNDQNMMYEKEIYEDNKLKTIEKYQDNKLVKKYYNDN